jgi:hypothetical protein
MPSNFKRSVQAAQRSADRRQREDDSPRLKAEIPTLATLKVAVVEEQSGVNSKHIKHVVVASAPALFVFPCGDEVCVDGGHDVTSEIMRVLRSKIAHATGESKCEGMTGSAPCARHITYELTATYGA